MFNNLHFPEIEINYPINILLSKSMIPEDFCFIKPSDFNTSTFLPLLKLIDKSETINKVTFIPIEYLRNKYKNELNELKKKGLCFSDELEEKNFLFTLLNKYNKIDYNFLLNEKINDIPLFFFKKPILFSQISNAKDVCFVLYNENINLYKSIGYSFNKIENKHLNIKTNTKDTYLNNITVSHFFEICNYMSNDVYFVKSLISFSGKIYIDFKNLKTDKRFLVGILLIDNHYLSFIIDTKCKSSNNNLIKKNLYLFNSSGFKKNFVGYNNKYLFIESDISITQPESSYFIKDPPYKPVIDRLDKEFNFDYIFLNKYKKQFKTPECGLYIVYFNFIFYERLTKIKDINNFNCRDMLLIYNNMYLASSDLYTSMLRGIFYITKDDLNINEIDSNKYYDSVNIFHIFNKKFKEFEIIYEKSLNRLKNYIENI